MGASCARFLAVSLMVALLLSTAAGGPVESDVNEVENGCNATISDTFGWMAGGLLDAIEQDNVNADGYVQVTLSATYDELHAALAALVPEALEAVAAYVVSGGGDDSFDTLSRFTCKSGKWCDREKDKRCDSYSEYCYVSERCCVLNF